MVNTMDKEFTLSQIILAIKENSKKVNSMAKGYVISLIMDDMKVIS